MREVRLAGRADGQPAEAVEHGVVADLEPELLRVELLGALLVEHEDVDVARCA